MSKELIDQYVDRAAFGSDTEFAVEQLKRVYDQLQKVATFKTTFRSGGLSETAEASKKLSLELNELKKKNLELGVAQKELNIQNKQAAEQRKAAAAEDKRQKAEEIKATKDLADAEKAAAAQEKKDRDEQLRQGRERIEQIRLETEAQEKANQAAQKGASYNPSGNYNPGGNNGPAKPKIKEEAFNPSDLIEKNILILNKEKEALAKNQAAQKALKKDRDAGAIGVQAYNKKLTQLTEAELEHKSVIGKVQMQIKDYRKYMDSATQSIESQRVFLNKITRDYDSLSPFERMSADGKMLKKTLDDVTANLKKLEAESGRAQRNVGNYGSAFDTASKGAGKLFSVLRNIAYVVPGLGLAGVIGLFIDPIIAGTKYLLGFGEVSEKVKKQQEDIAAAFKGAADGVADEISKVTVLKAVLESENASRLQKITALKQLKEINPDYFGQLDIETGKIDGLTLAYDAYVGKLIRSIEAKANIEQLSQALKEQAGIIADINKNGVADGPFNTENITQFQRMDAIRRFGLTFGASKRDPNQNKNIKDATIVEPAQEQLIVDLLNAEFRVKKITDKIKANIKDAFDPKNEKEKKEKEKKEKKGKSEKEPGKKKLSDTIDESFEREKIQRQDRIKGLEEEAGNEKSTFDFRLGALQTFTTERSALLQAQTNEDIRRIEAARDNDISNLELEKKKGADIDGINKEIAIKRANADEKIKTRRTQSISEQLEIEKDFNKRLLDITKEAADKRNALLKEADEQEESRITSAFSSRMEIIERERANDIQILGDRLAKKEITQKQYDKTYERIQAEAQQKALEAEIRYTKAVLTLAAIRIQSIQDPAMRAKAEEELKKANQALAKLEAEFAKKSIDNAKKTRDEINATLISTFEQIQNIGNQVLGIIASAVDASVTATKNRIEEQIEGVEKLRDAELKANDARVQSDQDRAANAILINARADAQREALERKKKQADLKKAQIDKAIAIFNIILGTAVAVAKATTIPEKVLAAVLGAAQLAVAAATPLPRFKHGLNRDYEGPAVVGDGGKSELIQRADGSMEITPAKDTMTYIKKGDRIHPDADQWVNETLAAVFKGSPIRNRPMANNSGDGDLSRKLDTLTNVIRNKRELHLTGSQAGIKAMFNHASHWTMYTKDQTNW